MSFVLLSVGCGDYERNNLITEPDETFTAEEDENGNGDIVNDTVVGGNVKLREPAINNKISVSLEKIGDASIRVIANAPPHVPLIAPVDVSYWEDQDAEFPDETVRVTITISPRKYASEVMHIKKRAGTAAAITILPFEELEKMPLPV